MQMDDVSMGGGCPRLNRGTSYSPSEAMTDLRPAPSLEHIDSPESELFRTPPDWREK
jgi:hypothetical protein